MKDNPIRISISLPSVTLRRFIEKLLKDEDFFSFALENPLGAMRECGVRPNAQAFIPADFATFFAAMSNLRELLQRKKVKREEMTFEKIFGRAAEMHGATLNAEITQGFSKAWDNRDAVSDKMKCFSASQGFEVDAGRQATSAKQLCQTLEVQQGTAFIGDTGASRDRFQGYDTQWDKADAKYHTESTRIMDKGFEKGGRRTLQDLLSGPLIHPEHLAAVSATIQTYVQATGDLGGEVEHSDQL